MRPCGYYPKSSRRPEWSELSLPPSLQSLAFRAEEDPVHQISQALIGRGERVHGPAQMRRKALLGFDAWVGPWSNAIAILAHHGYEPVIPALVPPVDPDLSPTRAMLALGTLENNPRLEPYYADYATRFLIGYTLVNMGRALQPPDRWWEVSDEEARETLAGLMPLICSLWPYADFAHANVANYDLLDWKSVGSVVRFQGR